MDLGGGTCATFEAAAFDSSRASSAALCPVIISSGKVLAAGSVLDVIAPLADGSVIRTLLKRN